jgi:hypothetical protein
VWPFLGAFGRERHGAGEIDRKAGRSGRETGKVQPAGAHRFDLGGVRVDRVIDHALAGALREVVGERLEDRAVHRRVFHRRVGEHQRRRVAMPLWVLRGIGDQILVFIAVERVELAAMLAVVGLRKGPVGRQRSNEQKCSEQAKRRDPALAHEGPPTVNWSISKCFPDDTRGPEPRQPRRAGFPTH